MMSEEKNRWRNAGNGGSLGTRPSCGITPTVVLVFIIAIGLSQCAEEPHSTTPPTACGPSPSPENKLEKAKSILGVTDQPLREAPPSPHLQGTPDIRKIITSMRKGFFAKKSQASVHQGFLTDTTSPGKPNEGLIKSILKAVSDAGEAGKREVEREEEEEGDSEAGEEVPLSTRDEEASGKVSHGEDEGRSKGKGKLLKAIKEVVLRGEELPEQPEILTQAPSPMENVEVVEGKMDKAGGPVSSEVLDSVEVTEAVQKEVESVVSGVSDSEGGSEMQKTEGESENSEKQEEKVGKETNGLSEGKGSSDKNNKRTTGDSEEKEMDGASESKETEAESNNKGTRGETVDQEKRESEVLRKSDDAWKEEETGGTSTIPMTAVEGNEGVQPLGKGIEVVTEALGVLDVKVTPGLSNTSISPAPVVAGRRNILSKKPDVTLSHILGAKEFFSHFPAGNFTYLHTPKPRPFYPKLSYKDTPVQEAEPQHKTEPEPAEERASEPIELRTEDSAGDHVAQEVSHSSTQTKTQETEDGEDTQERLDDAVPPSMVTVEKTEASPVEEVVKERTEVDDKKQQHQQQELPQVENIKKDNHLKPSSNDTDVKKEAQYPRESIESVNAEAKEVTEVPVTASDQPTGLQTTMEGNATAETLPSARESKKVSEETLLAEVGTDTVATVNVEVEATKDTSTEQTNVTEKEKEVHLVPDAEEEKEDRDKPIGDADIPGEVSKKKKPSDPEKTKRKEAPEKTIDSKQEPSDTLETYSQFTQRVNAEKKNDIISNGHGSNGHGKGPKVKSKNYASPDCGSKLLAANPEASHSSKVIHSNKDEYLLNKCRDKTWFVIELCESIRPQKFDIANFELFSNLPKDIHLSGSHRYPSREWTPLARARGQEGNRGVQSFPVETEDFFKYIKIEVHSHYGSEFFCPISLFRIYGLSEFEVIDTAEEPEEPEEEVFSDTQPEEKRSKEEGKPSVIPAVIKNMFSGVLDVIKRGYRPHSSSSEPDGSCYSLQPKHAVDKRTCQLADSLNYILSCYHAEYQVLMRQSFVSRTVKNSGFCRLLASTMCTTPEVSDSTVYDTACNSSYLCIMLSPKHTLAMCFMHDSRIMDSQVACESTGTLLPENFSTTTPTILPPENGMPAYLKNAKMNTSTITRTDATIPNTSTHKAREGLVHGQDKNAKQVAVEQVSVGPEEAPSSAPADASATEASKPEKGQAAGGTLEQAVKEAEQLDNSTAPEEAAQMEGSGFVGLEPSEDESAREEEKQEEELPLPVTPLPVEPKVSSTSPTNKESVVVRLSNKIKALEYNMSISSQYLEELSRRYKQQMEEMQRQFNLTIAALNATSHQAFERDQHHQRDIETLEEQLASVSAILSKLVDERESLAHTVVEQHLLLMVVEVVVLCVVFVLCHKRTTRHRLLQLEGQDRRAQTPSEDPSDRQVLGSSSSSTWSRGRVRRRSVDSITRERSAHQRRCRRPSEEALRISGTYEDLLIIEPAIPIMVDSVSDRKKKKKSSSGTLKRSKSNASIVEKSCNSTRRSRRIENLDMSSAGVLFCGDQVDSREAPVTPRTDSTPPHPSRTPQESAVSVDITSSKPLVEEVMSDSYSYTDTQMVSAKRHSVTGCQNSESIIRKGAKLSKSHSISCTAEKLRNNADKKKTKKLKKKNIGQEGQHHFIHESEVCEQTNRTTYNGYVEHIPEYYYNGRNSVHFSETSDNVTNHMFNTDVADDNSYVNGSEDLGYVGSDCMHSGYMTNLPDRQRPSPAARVKLRSNNWEWYSLQQCGSSSETVSTSSDSSGKIQKGKCRDVPQTVEQSNEKKARKKKKSKSRSPVVLEEETNGGT